MATNIPPHNLRELVKALEILIDRFDEVDDVTIEDLMQVIPGPDFPTGGIIVGDEGIRSAYSTGRGRLIMRGVATIEETKTGRFAIRISEIPYQLNKTSLIERIAELVREGKLDQISDLRDESDRKGMRIIIELKRTAQPKKVLNQLFKYTALQSTFGVQLLALVNGEPHMLSLKKALIHYIEHRQLVITRRTMFDMDKAKKRAHILDGLLIALNNLDAVIKTIRGSKDGEEAKNNLIARFNLSDLQAQAILDMQLRRLAALERIKIDEEYKQVTALIADLEDILAHPQRILGLISTDLQEVAAKYGNDRRTRIDHDMDLDLSDESLVQAEPVFVSITNRGYIKRVSDLAYRSQGRGGRGVLGQSMREEDQVVLFHRCNTLDTLLFFTDKGKVYSGRVFEVPEESRQSKGLPVINLINLLPDETVTSILAVKDFNAFKYCVMATRNGRVKRIPLGDFSDVRISGLIAIRLDAGDELRWVVPTNGEDDVVLVSKDGKALRFHENQVRKTGRTTMGVTGIHLSKKDHLIGVELVEKNGSLLVITENGKGKRTPLEEYIPKSRGTLGVSTIDRNVTDQIGRLAQAKVVQDAEEVTIISRGGIVMRTKVASISVQGRATQGVKIMDLEKDDNVAAIARIPAEEIATASAAASQAANSPEETF
jgi:DNA gyrase subunit A